MGDDLGDGLGEDLGEAFGETVGEGIGGDTIGGMWTPDGAGWGDERLDVDAEFVGGRGGGQAGGVLSAPRVVLGEDEVMMIR